MEGGKWAGGVGGGKSCSEKLHSEEVDTRAVHSSS